MKKTFVIVLSLLISSCFVACGQASSSKPTAKAKRVFSETTSQHKDLAINYSLDKEIEFGDIKLSVDNRWDSSSSGNNMMFFYPKKELSLCLSKENINSSLISEDDIFEIHSEPKSTQKLTDNSYEMVAGNKVMLFSHEPITNISKAKYSRHMVFVVNDASYDIYTQGSADDWNSCKKIFSDVFGTLDFPFKDNLHHNTTTTESITEEPTEKTTEKPTEPMSSNDVDQLLYQDDKVNLYYVGSETVSYGYHIVSLRIENNSPSDYHFILQNVTVNDYVIKPVFDVSIPAGKKAVEKAYFSDSDLKDNRIEKINTVEFQLHYYDSSKPLNERERFTSDYIVINL